MADKAGNIEEILKGLPYGKDSSLNPILRADFVKNSDYFSGLGLTVKERYIYDNYPHVSKLDYLQFNNLYNTGFFSDYFERQYKTLETLYKLRPGNFPKPVSLVVNDSDRKVGYVYAPLGIDEARNYVPTAVSLHDYLADYKELDERLVIEKIRRVGSLEDLFRKEDLDRFIFKKGVKKLSRNEKYVREYKIRMEVYGERKRELENIRNQINESIDYISTNGFNHNNLRLDNVMIYHTVDKKVKVGFVDPLNEPDLKSKFFGSDKYRLIFINARIRFSEAINSALIRKYADKYKAMSIGLNLK